MDFKYYKNALPLNLRGFRANALNIYSLSSVSELAPYLSYMQRQKAFRILNADIKELVNNKYAFPKLLGKWATYVPENQIVIKNNRIVESIFEGDNQLTKALKQANGRIVVKPAVSLRGRGVSFLSLRGSEIFVDGHAVTEAEFLMSLDKNGLYIACPHVQQHPDLAAIFSDATASLRMMTFFDDESQKPEILATIARIGTSRSAPFEAPSSGGLGVLVHPETGVLSRALEITDAKSSDGMASFAKHPDTDVQIEGSTLPNWEMIKEKMLLICSDLPLLEFAGWDIVVTETGFQILEANVRPSQDSIQMHMPMLANPRFRAFLTRKGVL